MCARFLGTDSVRFLDERSFTGNAFSQLEEALAFVARNTRQQPVITGRPEHEVVPEYPADAVREAITNAICHRDYTTTGTVQATMIAWKCGIRECFPQGFRLRSFTVSTCLVRGIRDWPRLFHRARLIEHWGTGTLRIVRACEERGMPKPEFVSAMGSFIVRLGKPKITMEHVDSDRMTQRQRAALNYLREHGSITTGAYGKRHRHHRPACPPRIQRRRTGRSPNYRGILGSSDRGNT